LCSDNFFLKKALALPMAETSLVLGIGYSLMQLDDYRTIIQLQTKISFFSTISHNAQAATNSDLAKEPIVKKSHRAKFHYPSLSLHNGWSGNRPTNSAKFSNFQMHVDKFRRILDTIFNILMH
jgi:hypothetical protein